MLKKLLPIFFYRTVLSVVLLISTFKFDVQIELRYFLRFSVATGCRYILLRYQACLDFSW